MAAAAGTTEMVTKQVKASKGVDSRRRDGDALKQYVQYLRDSAIEMVSDSIRNRKLRIPEEASMAAAAGTTEMVTKQVKASKGVDSRRRDGDALKQYVQYLRDSAIEMVSDSIRNRKLRIPEDKTINILEDDDDHPDIPLDFFKIFDELPDAAESIQDNHELMSEGPGIHETRVEEQWSGVMKKLENVDEKQVKLLQGLAEVVEKLHAHEKILRKMESLACCPTLAG